MKRLLSIILCMVIILSSVTVVDAKGNKKYKYNIIKVEYSDNRGKLEELSVMTYKDNLYVDAKQIAKRLGYDVEVGDAGVTIFDKKSNGTKRARTMFEFGSTKIKHFLLKVSEAYQAPFESIKDGETAWIPLEYSLLTMNGSMLVVDGVITIDMPVENIMDIFMDAELISKYGFDWTDDLGYTETEWMTIGISSHLVNVFNGLLKKDGASWVQMAQSLALDSSSYDAKYGKEIAMLFCVQSNDELEQTVKQMKEKLEYITADGKLGKALSEIDKYHETNVAALYDACSALKDQIGAENPSSIGKYNRAYQELEDACDKATWFSHTGGVILQMQKEISGVTKGLNTIFKVAEVVGYAQEFQNQDEFSIQALETYIRGTDSSSLTSKAMKDSVIGHLNMLKSDVLAYSALRYLEENIDDLIMDAADLGSVLGTQATLALIAWDFASGNIKWIADGLSSADQFELALYAMVLQGDALISYQEAKEALMFGKEDITAESLYKVSQYCYAYLKSCYIARSAALSSLEIKMQSKETRERLRPLIEEQNRINEEIAGCLVRLRNADKSNSRSCYGFLVEDNQKYLDENGGVQTAGKQDGEYTWAIEPTIEADNIYYLNGISWEETPVNLLHKQLGKDQNLGYAVIKKGDAYGLIDQNGELLEGMEYQSVDVYYSSYEMRYSKPHAKLGGDDVMEVALYEEGVSYVRHGDSTYLYGGVYYWDDGLKKLSVYSHNEMPDPTETIPVKKGKVEEELVDKEYRAEIDEWYETQKGKYAIYTNSRLVTDFIYDECGSCSEGLLAVCKDEKWGYVNENGEIIIPIEYDASWKEYSPKEGHRENGKREEYCYAATDGYVVLCKNNEWELRDIHGESVIPSGVFEELRPVYDGKCWAKKDGKWGVLKISDFEVDDGEIELWKQKYIETVKETERGTGEDKWGGYKLVYIDEDDIPELYIMSGIVALGDTLLTYKDGELVKLHLYSYGLSYMELQNMFRVGGGRMDRYHDYIYKIEDGKFVMLHKGEFGAEEQTNVQCDEEGNFIYEYVWDGIQVSKEEYEANLEAVYSEQEAKIGCEDICTGEEIIKMIEEL